MGSFLIFVIPSPASAASDGAGMRSIVNFIARLAGASSGTSKYLHRNGFLHRCPATCAAAAAAQVNESEGHVGRARKQDGEGRLQKVLSEFDARPAPRLPR